MQAQNDSLIKKYARITSVVALYWVVSISMVFLNKKLLGGSNKGEKDAPLFVTAFQCFITGISGIVLSKIISFFPNVSFPTLGPIDLAKAKKVFPLTIMFVCMITFNNLCLKYVGVAFYYVGRSLTTVFNVLFTFFILGEKTSFKSILCCGIIIAGFFLGVDQEGVAGTLSIFGVFSGILASAFVSLNAIFTKKVLPEVDGSIWELSYYNSVLSMFIFIPLIVVFGEGKTVCGIVLESDLQYWALMVLGGLFGYAIGFVTGLQIKVTSPLTHNVSGTAKACCQTVIATTWYNDPKSLMWWASNWVILAGTLAYTKVKNMEMVASFNRDRRSPLKS